MLFDFGCTVLILNDGLSFVIVPKPRGGKSPTALPHFRMALPGYRVAYLERLDRVTSSTWD
ncbi:MAG: hypothetical protein KGH99_01660 [Thaumarchaeota archaeon]|nr:hypothetical protein [Nitrososphaerota archaeon]MDE1872166.1 hypothetical protein [Nitrososphaerota archaeon]